jgi:hypothetical protein
LRPHVDRFSTPGAGKGPSKAYPPPPLPDPAESCRLRLCVLADTSRRAGCSKGWPGRGLRGRHRFGRGFPLRRPAKPCIDSLPLDVCPCRTLPDAYDGGMANLIPCPSCHQMISSMAASCPKCGHPLRSASSPLGKRNTIVLVSIIVVTLLASSALVLYNHLSEARARADEIQAEFDAVLKGMR